MSESFADQTTSIESTGKDPVTTSRLAIASLVLGFLSMILSCLAGLPGVILAIIALMQINGSKGQLKGSGLAVAGLILSVMMSLFTLVIAILIGMLLPAVEQVRDAAQRTEEATRIRQLSEEAHEYHDQQKPVETKALDDGPAKSAK